VLSGGGARGAAHIGVLKVLEELRVPVDCITATSMGSIVGGAYASGLSVPEMEKAVGEINSTLLFVERPPREDLAMRRKLDDRSILFGVELGIDKEGLKLPKGIVSGVQLESVLRGLVKTPGYRKFDELPIPYRAVATDLESGTAVVIAEGEIAHAMRASMSVPGAIAPAEQNGRILVDGGLTDNLPVEVARSMGADVVIAVNLGTPLLKRDSLGSVLGVTAQMINILTEQNVRASLASLKATDILIEPELGNFSASDFDDLQKTIPIGEAAARKVADRLAKLALSAEEFQRFQVARAAPQPPRQPIDEIRFAPLARVNPDVPRGWMDTKTGVPIDDKALDQDLRRIYGTGDFERVGYSIVEERNRRVLIVDAVEKAWGPDYLKAGLGLGSDFKGDDFFNLAVSYRRTWLNPLGAEWRTDLQVGNTTRAATEFYQPVFVTRSLFVAPRAEVVRQVQDVYRNDQRVARYDVRTGLAGVDVGSEFGRYGELRLGLAAGAVRPTETTGSPLLAPPKSKSDEGAATMRFIVDQLDSANFPRHGYAGRFAVYDSHPGLGADYRYTRVDADAIGAMSWGRSTVSVALRGGTEVSGNPLPSYDMFTWGGFLQQSGFPRGALTGERLAFGRVVYTYQLARQKIFDGVYAGASLEQGYLGKPLVPGAASGSVTSGSLFLGMDTPVGPMYLAYGHAQRGHSAFYFYLGRP
jgi:NTE family protein